MGLFRGQQRDSLRLGEISLGTGGSSIKTRGETPRFQKLDKFEQYYLGKQYDGLIPWQKALKVKDRYIPIRDRKPSINSGIPAKLVDRTASALFGARHFPSVRVDADPDTESYAKAVMKQAMVQAKMTEIAKWGLASGSVLVTFSLMSGKFVVDFYRSKYCTPVFNEMSGDLETVTIQYKYLDEEDPQPNTWRWYKRELTMTSEVLYDNPKVTSEDPAFQETSRVDHNFGFVTAEWFTIGDRKESIDGVSLLDGPIMDLTDSLNYSLSQSDQAVAYNQDPQTVFKGMSEDELDGLIRSSQKAWALGHNGEASLLEMSGSGLEKAKELRTEVGQLAMEASRVIILDPKEISGHANSGVALERMHAPFVELVEEIQPWFGDNGLVPLLQKMLVAGLMMRNRGFELAFEIPAEYSPISLEIELDWPPIFPPTPSDLQQLVAAVNLASTGQLIARETGTRYLARYFGIRNVEEELQKIADQPPPPSPFGAF